MRCTFCNKDADVYLVMEGNKVINILYLCEDHRIIKANDDDLERYGAPARDVI
jgi:hypothetical protein